MTADTLICAWLGCLIANFSWALCVDKNWGEATKVTAFQALPLITVFIVAGLHAA